MAGDSSSAIKTTGCDTEDSFERRGEVDTTRHGQPGAAATSLVQRSSAPDPCDVVWSLMSLEVASLVLRIVLAAAFAAMGVLHFVPSVARGMAAMIPPALGGGDRSRARSLVAVTGVCEIAGGVGLLVPATQSLAGVLLAVFLVAVFPANAYAAARPERFGRMAVPFWPRLGGQVVLIALCLLAAIRV